MICCLLLVHSLQAMDRRNKRKFALDQIVFAAHTKNHFKAIRLRFIPLWGRHGLCRPLPGDAMTPFDYIAIVLLIVLALAAAANHFLE